MKIERIPNDILVLRAHLAEATTSDGKKINVSLAGGDLIVEIDHELYSVSIESIVRDVIEFSEVKND